MWKEQIVLKLQELLLDSNTFQLNSHCVTHKINPFRFSNDTRAFDLNVIMLLRNHLLISSCILNHTNKKDVLLT